MFFDEFLTISPRKNVFLSEIKIFDFGRFWHFDSKNNPYFHKGRRSASRSGSRGGVEKSQKFKNGENVLKQPKTIIESRPGTPQSVPDPYRDPLRGTVVNFGG